MSTNELETIEFDDGEILVIGTTNVGEARKALATWAVECGTDPEDYADMHARVAGDWVWVPRGDDERLHRASGDPEFHTAAQQFPGVMFQ